MLIQSNITRVPLHDESVDLIFTDPPYGKAYLPVYEWLAREAERILRPGGFLLLMCGGAYLNQVFQALDLSGLEYFWKYEIELTGPGAGVFWMNGNTEAPVISRSKPVLAYGKGESLPRKATLSPVKANAADKRWHHWGQDVSSVRYFIDCFSAKDDLICDPMIGGGTTAVACQLLNRRFVGLDLDWEACQISKKRMENSDAVTNLPLFQMTESE